MAGKRILMGVVGRPHGVKGLVRVASYAAEPASLSVYGPLWDERDRRFALTWRGDGVAALAEIIGEQRVPIADRNTAARLTNTRLYLDRDQLPPAAAEEFYLADLEGMAALDEAGVVLGTVAAVHDYGAGASLEIARPPAPPVLVPFTRACVPEIDPEAGRLRVVLPYEAVVAEGEGAAA